MAVTPASLRAVVLGWSGTLLDFGSRAPGAAFTKVFADEGVPLTGIVDPVEAVGRMVREERRLFFADSMSAFGAVPLDLETAGVDVLGLLDAARVTVEKMDVELE